MNDFIITSAVEFEINPLVEKIKLKSARQPQTKCLGIGPLNAIENALSEREFFRGKDVLWVGSCGLFKHKNSHLKIGDVFVPESTFWAPACARMGLAHSFAPEIIDLKKVVHPSFSNTEINSCVLTSSSISYSDACSQKTLEDWQIQDKILFENMELYVVAKVLIPVVKSFTAIMGITNYMGPEGRSEWKANFKQVALNAAEFVCPRHPREGGNPG